MAALLKFGRKRERNGATKVASELSADVTDFASSQRSAFSLYFVLLWEIFIFI